MNTEMLVGNQVRLAAVEPEKMSKAFNLWGRDTEYHRLLNFDPAHQWSEKKWKEWLDKDLEKEPTNEFFFAIQHVADQKLIGFIGLMEIAWNHGDAWVAIGIGERSNWGKGYGTEAMRLLLQYGFSELNLHRITLGVFEYNQRAVRSYEKAGFILEGRQRGLVQRDGRQWDVFVMGILKPDWESQQGSS